MFGAETTASINPICCFGSVGSLSAVTLEALLPYSPAFRAVPSGRESDISVILSVSSSFIENKV